MRRFDAKDETKLMRVLHVSAYFAPAFRYGGPPRSVFALCQHLQRQGVEVEVLTTTANGTEDFAPSPDGGESYEGIPVRYLRRTFPRRFFGAAGLRAALSDRLSHCDLVHIHGLWNVPSNQAAMVARRRGVPYVISPRGMLQRRTLARSRLRKIVAYHLVERANLAGASLLHATSTEEAETLEGLGLGVRVAMMPNGVEEPGPMSPSVTFRQEWGIRSNAPLIVALGRIHPVKRLDLLIAAFAKLLLVCPEARLIIAGPDEGGHAEELRRRCGAELRNIVWTGHLDSQEKWRLLSEATVMAMCSDSESFGLSLAEAMLSAVPVVVTKTCPWEEVEQCGAGLRVDQNVEAMAAALRSIVNDPGAARNMGERGHELVQTRYAWGPIAAMMAGLYEEIMSPRRELERRTPSVAAGSQ